jgi:RNA polymerase sigma-70 factor (ECF subfamily)
LLRAEPEGGVLRYVRTGNLWLPLTPMRELRDNSADRLWEAQRGELYGFVLKRVRDEAAAEDIVHDALVKAYERRETLKEPRKLRPWLFQITRNAMIDHFRSQKPAEPLPEDLIVEDPEEGERAERELARCLLPLLDELPEPYRDALRLAEVEGSTQRQVASRLGLSLSGAKSRVQRGRRMLRRALFTCCSVELDRRGGSAGRRRGRCRSREWSSRRRRASFSRDRQVLRTTIPDSIATPDHQELRPGSALRASGAIGPESWREAYRAAALWTRERRWPIVLL